jgi:hypothetical protein
VPGDRCIQVRRISRGAPLDTAGRRHVLRGRPPEQEQKLVWATYYAPAADLFSRNAPGVAWKSKPSWYIVAYKDRTVQPELDSWRSGWVQASTLSTAATSRCCPIQASSSMLSVPPQRPFKDQPPELDGRRGCPSIKIRPDEHRCTGDKSIAGLCCRAATASVTQRL